MKNMRIEVQVTVFVHAGRDIPCEGSPGVTRRPDAMETAAIARTVTIGEHHQTRDAASTHLLTILADAGPVLAKCLAHQLRTKGH